MTDMAALELWRLILEMSFPSMRILPCDSGKRNKAANRDDFPDPVCPTIPTYKQVQEFGDFSLKLKTAWIWAFYLDRLDII